MRVLHCTFLLLCAVAAVFAQTYPDTSNWVGQNCDGAGIEEGDCASINTPFVNVIDNNIGYPDDGFCIVRDLDQEGSAEPTSYIFTQSLCQDYSFFDGGIYFNYVDADNYDTFYTLSSNPSQCIVGYLEEGAVYETDSFECRPGTEDVAWFKFEVYAQPGSATVRLFDYDGNSGDSFTFTPNFDSNPIAGGLHANDLDSHSHLHFAEYTLDVSPVSTDAPDTTTPSTEGTTIDGETTTTTEPPGFTQPQYQIRISADYESGNGEDFTEACTEQYSDDMDAKTRVIGQRVNNFIGSTLCTSITSADAVIVATSGQLNSDGSTGNNRNSFYMEFSTNVYLSDIEACVEDVTQYVIPYSNWGDTVLPPIDGCPAMDFLGDQFNDNSDYWVCVEGRKEHFAALPPPLSPLDVTPPTYRFIHEGQFEVENGEDLTPNCQDVYRSGFYANSNTMVDGINTPDGDSLCPGLDFTLYISSVFLTAQNGQGTTQSDYRMDARGDIRFIDISNCANTISEYLANHENWMDPIIPDVASCPALTFNPEEFTETINNWICLPVVAPEAGKLNKEIPKPELYQKSKDAKVHNKVHKTHKKPLNRHTDQMQKKFLRYLKEGSRP